MKLLTSIEAHGGTLSQTPALVFGREILSYGALVRGARRLAGVLAQRCRAGNGPVAVLGGREALTPLCFLACAFAGAAFLPLDPACPPARRQAILRDSRAPLCLDLLSASASGEEFSCPVLNRAAVLQALEAPEQALPGLPCDEELFYLIYTSGSSGTPKGVEITRGNLSAFLAGALPLFGGTAPVTLSHAAFSFDLSVLPLWGTLALGGTYLDLDPALDWRQLFGRMSGSGATFWVSTPAFARLCLADPAFDRRLLPRLKTFFFCGETLPPATVHALFTRFPGSRIINAYGPTEATVAVTWCAVNKEMLAGPRPLPVGAPFPGVRVLVVDELDHPLPEGVQGEILLAGPTVAKGYRGAPAAGGPFGVLPPEEGGLPCYRTGDLGFLEGGTLHFRGRKDRQVKLRGFRLELEDVEANLRTLEGVAAAAVVLAGEGENPRLLAAVEPVPGISLDPGAVREALRALVPPHMVPRRVVVLERLPTTTGGKVDLCRTGALLL